MYSIVRVLYGNKKSPRKRKKERRDFWVRYT